MHAAWAVVTRREAVIEVVSMWPLGAGHGMQALGCARKAVQMWVRRKHRIRRLLLGHFLSSALYVSFG